METAEERFHLAYLTSAPLVYNQKVQGRTTLQPLDRLDMEEEARSLTKALNESGRAVAIRRMTATSQNLMHVFVQGCRAIHYSGHGLPNCLAFENEEGMMHKLKAKDLQDAARANARGGRSNLKFVCVSACHSQDAGEAFVQSGVPHVVAVRSHDKVWDIASQIFFKAFYMSILQGDTVKHAFEMAKTSVKIHNKTGNSEESKKFVLLPESEDHEVPIFTNIDKGKWKDLTPKPPVSTPRITRAQKTFGREVETQKILNLILKKHLVVLTGEPGIGKSTLASVVANYCYERAHDYDLDGVFYIDVADPKYINERSLGSICSRVMEEVVGKCSSNEGFMRAVSSDGYLLVLDGIDRFLNVESPADPFHVPTFMSDMFKDCLNVRCIVVSRQPLSRFENYEPVDSVVEKVFVLNRLNSEQSAKLFMARAPRSMFKAEVSSMEKLRRHEVIKYLNGNPKRICTAAPYLQECKLDKLLDLLKKKDEGRDTGREEEKNPYTPKQLSRRGTYHDDLNFSEFNSLCKTGDRSAIGRTLNEYLCGNVSRTFSESELNQIANKIDASGPLDDVWRWLTGLKKIIRNTRNLWCDTTPLIKGMASGGDVRTWLSGGQTGTFLIRFSSLESYLVVCILVEDRIINYLVGAEDDGTFSFEVTNDEDETQTLRYGTLSDLIMKLHEATHLYVSEYEVTAKEQLFRNM